MVVLMVAGGAALIPESLFDPVRPMPASIVAEMAESPFGSSLPCFVCHRHRTVFLYLSVQSGGVPGFSEIQIKSLELTQELQ